MVLLTFLFMLSAYTSLVLFSPLCIICERMSRRLQIAEELKHKIQLKPFSVLFRYKFQVVFLSFSYWSFFLHSDMFGVFFSVLRDHEVEEMIP